MQLYIKKSLVTLSSYAMFTLSMYVCGSFIEYAFHLWWHTYSDRHLHHHSYHHNITNKTDMSVSEWLGIPFIGEVEGWDESKVLWTNYWYVIPAIFIAGVYSYGVQYMSKMYCEDACSLTILFGLASTFAAVGVGLESGLHCYVHNLDCQDMGVFIPSYNIIHQLSYEHGYIDFCVKNHIMHHINNGTTNFNAILPLADYLLGTYAPPNDVAGAYSTYHGEIAAEKIVYDRLIWYGIGEEYIYA